MTERHSEVIELVRSAGELAGRNRVVVMCVRDAVELGWARRWKHRKRRLQNVRITIGTW